MLYLILEIKFSRKSDFISVFTFKSNARETWCVILVSESWHILPRITALYTPFRSAQNHCLPDNVRPRGAFISVGDCTPTEKDLLLLTTCRSGSLLDWDKKLYFLQLEKEMRSILYTLHRIQVNMPRKCKKMNRQTGTFFLNFCKKWSRMNLVC